MRRDVDPSFWAALFGPAASVDRVAADLREMARFERHAPGTLLVTAGEPAVDVIGLVVGQVSVGTTTESEHGSAFLPERSVSAPGWIDPSSAWREDGVHLYSARAEGQVDVMRLAVAELSRQLARHPSLGGHLLELLADEIGRLSGDVRDLLQKDAEARLAGWLLRRLDDEATGPGGHEIHLTERKRQIAVQLGIKPETLSRLLRTLTRKGLVEVFGYRVRVLDAGALRAIASG
jgi:CRP-like cAMP-binding protein